MPEDQATQRNGALAARQAGELAGAYSHTVERLAPDLDLVPVMIQGLDGVIHHWSAGCERLYGFSVTEAVGRVARELLQTESPVPAADIDAALHCDGHWTGELGQRRRDGRRIWVLAQRTLRPGAAGTRGVLVENSSDASRLHEALATAQQAEALQREATENLGVQVAELQRHLSHAQKMEAVGQLTSSVAHDFNNFVTIVLANAEHLRTIAETAGNAHGVRQADMIERAGERGARLAAQLLAFARKQTLFPETVAVEPLLAEMRELLCRAAAAPHDLQIRCAADIWAILVDPTQLESALLNLVINARDAVAASGGTIAITAENATLNLAEAARLQVPPGEFVRIAVADNGGGIAPEMLERVFEPFFTTKEVGRGSGIGLAQVHGLVAQSGGAIDIESEVGRGTKVAMLLPRAPWAVVERMTDAPLADMAGNGQCVLLVEDQEDLRETARTMLEERGYRVMAAADAPAARTILAGAEPISVLFADLVLPLGESGLDLARVAQQLRPDIRVLLTSGYTKDVLDQFGVQAREFEFLLKPYSTRKLSARIGRLLAGAIPPPLKWSAAHEVGIRMMDEQHARLAELLNDLAAVVKSGEDHAVALNDIISYTEFHFAAEARLMATHGYHDATAHRDVHRRLLEEIRAFRPAVNGASASLALHYLQDWLLGHVRGHDRELAEALRAQGMR